MINKNEKYEKDLKLSNGKWVFAGWSYITPLEQEKFCIEEKIRGKFLYRTFKYLSGNIEVERYKVK